MPYVIFTNSTGTIMNLPPIAYKRGDQHINFIEYPQNTTVSITLECRCFVYRPTWNHYKMTTMEETSPSGSSVQCKKNGKSCSTSIIFPFNQDPPNHYVYQTTTFVITEPSILMCSSWREKEMVIISLKQPGKAVTELSICTRTCSIGAIGTRPTVYYY